MGSVRLAVRYGTVPVRYGAVPYRTVLRTVTLPLPAIALGFLGSYAHDVLNNWMCSIVQGTYVWSMGWKRGSALTMCCPSPRGLEGFYLTGKGLPFQLIE